MCVFLNVCRSNRGVGLGIYNALKFNIKQALCKRSLATIILLLMYTLISMYSLIMLLLGISADTRQLSSRIIRLVKLLWGRSWGGTNTAWGWGCWWTNGNVVVSGMNCCGGRIKMGVILGMGERKRKHF